MRYIVAALALLAVADAIPRRVKHGKLQPRHHADPTATPPELHSTRVQGASCQMLRQTELVREMQPSAVRKFRENLKGKSLAPVLVPAAVPTGLARRCDWVMMNESAEGLLKFRSPPRTVFVSECIGFDALSIVADKLLPQLNESIVLFTASRDFTLPQQRTCGIASENETSRHNTNPTLPLFGHADAADTVDCKFGDFSHDQKEAIRNIAQSPLVERWVTENLVAPHPAKMSPMPQGFFAPDCQIRFDDPSTAYDAVADTKPGGVCANMWKFIRDESQSLPTERRLSMACTGHAHDTPDYNNQRDLRENCDEGGAWSHFSVAPGGSLDYEKWIAFLTETSFTACAPSSGGDPAPKVFEALAAGSIPIIKGSALDGAYRKLPVVVIDSWADAEAITISKLVEWRRKLAPYFASEKRAELERRLTLNFWFDQAVSGTSAGDYKGERGQDVHDWWLDARIQEDLPKGSSLPRAIMHVGPHKMGSSSLQASLSSFAHVLQKDGFNAPQVREGRQRLVAMAAHLRCHGDNATKARRETLALSRWPNPLRCEDAAVQEGWEDTLRELAQAHEEGRGLMLSTEDLDLPETDVEDLVSALHDYNLTTVVMYRPFFEWMISVHGQNAGKDLHGVRNSGQDVHHLLQCLAEEEISPHCETLNSRNLSDLAMQYTPFVDWMTAERMQLYLPTFTPAVVRRYSAFSKVRVQNIASTDDSYELVNRFFCRGWSPQTCKVAKTREAHDIQKGISTAAENEGGDLDALHALEAAIAAKKAGWLEPDESALKVMRFILADIKKGMLTIPLQCLDNATRDRLYNTTYDAEAELAGLVAHRADAPNTPEAELRRDFAAAANTTLCSAVISELKESPQLRGLIVRYLATRADVATQARRVRIVSVHTGDTDWIGQQAAQVQKHVDLPFSLFTSVNDGEEEAAAAAWHGVTGKEPVYVVSNETVMRSEKVAIARTILTAADSINHGVQLHHLAKRACHELAHKDDVLLFLDADAWPLDSLREQVLPVLDSPDNGIELIAVRRSVEGMALWPHPSFAATTCGTWRKYNMSWSLPPHGKVPMVYKTVLEKQIWKASKGLLCHSKPNLDTGAPLWSVFNDTSKNWLALERINRLDLDPLFYGVYGGERGKPLVFHQGAGSRVAATSKVTNGALQVDGYEEAAFALRDVVLAEQRKPGGYDALANFLAFPRTSALYKQAAGGGSPLLPMCNKVRDFILKQDGERLCMHRAQNLCQRTTALELIHVPKTGGTSIEDWGIKQSRAVQFGRHRTQWPQGNCSRGCRATWQPCSSWHLPPALFRANGQPAYGDASNAMCVVRNPFERVASHVAWLLRNKAKVVPELCSAHMVNQRLQAMLEAARPSLAQVAAAFPELHPSDMLRGALNETACREGENEADCQNRVVQPAFREDCHWLPQWMYVDGDGGGGDGECAHRMRTETLQADFSQLVSQTEGGAVNSTLDATNSRESTGCAINASIFNPATEALIRKVYARDFWMYGYTPALNFSAQLPHLGYGLSLLYDPSHGVAVGWSVGPASTMVVELFLQSISSSAAAAEGADPEAAQRTERSRLANPQSLAVLPKQHRISPLVLCDAAAAAAGVDPAPPAPAAGEGPEDEADVAAQAAVKPRLHFKFVTNPYSRAVEAYLHDIETKMSGRCATTSVQTKDTSVCTKLGFGKDMEGASFEAWLKVLHDVGMPELLPPYDDADDKIGMHALPQATRAEAMGCRFNRICKLEESVPACLRAVNEASGASYSLANLDGVLAKYAGSTKNTDLLQRAAPATASALMSDDEPGEDAPLDIDALGYDVAALPFWQLQQASSTPGVLPPRPALYFQGAAGARAQKLVQQLYDVDFVLYNYSHVDLPL